MILIRIFRICASLQLAISLLSFFATCLALATFLESAYSGHIAQDLIYHTWWFTVLLVCLAVNILCADQEPLSRYFASRDRPGGRAGFAAVPHTTAVTGSPVLDGAGGFLDCRLVDSHQAGDHVIFIGEVVAMGVDPDSPPLLFHHGRYRMLRDD